MSKYNHPLLQEVDFSQAKEPAMEMMLALYQQQSTFDLNPYMVKPFETPLFDRIADIRLNEENERFEFVWPDGETWGDFSLGQQSQCLAGSPGSALFVITMADSMSGLVGGYRLRSYPRNYRLVFDRLLWDELGQPLDGRGFRLECEGDWRMPVVVKQDETLMLRGYPGGQAKPYFPDMLIAEQITADFSLQPLLLDSPTVRPVDVFDLQVVDAVRRQPGWEGFSFADWQKAQADMKEQLEGSSTETLLQMPDIIPLRAWGYLDAEEELQLGVQIPEQGWIASLSSSFRPFDILHLYAHARRKSDFYQRHSKETLLTAIEIICTCLGICSNLKLKDVPYLVTEWWSASDVWFGGKMSRLAQMLVDHRLKPFRDLLLCSPNAHLLRNAEIDQWLPADFEITEQNQEGFLTFVHGLLYDWRDLTAQQTAKFFKECLCSSQAQQVKFQKMDGEVQLLDLMADGYFDRGRCSFSWGGGSVWRAHAWCCYPGRSLKYRWSSNPLPFSWKEQVVLEGFAFQMLKSEADWAMAGQYCGMDEPEVFPLASGRIPPVIVSLAGSPRVPIGIVEPLSADFELSDEFYQTLNEPKEQFNERFQQIVEQYWEIFDKKYPYLY